MEDPRLKDIKIIRNPDIKPNTDRPVPKNIPEGKPEGERIEPKNWPFGGKPCS